MAALHDLLDGMRGVVFPFGGTAAPAGFLMCDGQAVSRTTYAALFAVIGTTFGAGDGSTTFNVPDLRGEFIRGADRGRGVDTGRALGSSQQATAIAQYGNGTNGAKVALPIQNSEQTYSSSAVAGYRQIPQAYENVPTEMFFPMRSRNVAMNYVIKT